MRVKDDSADNVNFGSQLVKKKASGSGTILPVNLHVRCNKMFLYANLSFTAVKTQLLQTLPAKALQLF